MLNNLYIFHSTGKLLFSRKWTGTGTVKEDPVLISGFLSAIWMFAQKIGGGSGGGVRVIQTEENIMVGISSPTYDLLFVLVADPKADIASCKHLLSRMRRSFTQKYKKLLKQETDFSTDVFDDWIQNLDEILKDMDVSPVQSVMKKFLKNIVDETTEEPED
ncbi:MAG: hypothetical protein HWN66_11070 [Candidatus Helarchaeota archaeon]|nr:hypothetical protein [Candidatus Helarchaeota archaeon]